MLLTFGVGKFLSKSCLVWININYSKITIFRTLSKMSHLMYGLFAVDLKLSHEIAFTSTLAASCLLPHLVSFTSLGAHKKVILIFHLGAPSNKTNIIIPFFGLNEVYIVQLRPRSHKEEVFIH